MTELDRPEGQIPQDTRIQRIMDNMNRWRDTDLRRGLADGYLETKDLPSLQEYVLQLGITAYDTLTTQPSTVKQLDQLGFRVYTTLWQNERTKSVGVALKPHGYPYLELRQLLSPVDPEKPLLALDNQNYDTSWSEVVFNNTPKVIQVTTPTTTVLDHSFYITPQEKTSHVAIEINSLPMEQKAADALSDTVRLMEAINDSPRRYAETVYQIMHDSVSGRNSPTANKVIMERVSRLWGTLSTPSENQ